MYHAVGISQPVARVPGRADNVVAVQKWRHRPGNLCREDLRRHAEPVLHGDVAVEGRKVSLVVQQKKIAGPVQVDVLPQLLVETLQHRQTELREAHVDLGAELVANAAGALAGCFHAEQRTFFQQNDIGATAQGQVPGSAGSHHSATDDDDIRSLW